MPVNRLVKFCSSASKILLAIIMLSTVLTALPVIAGNSSKDNHSSSLVGKKKVMAANSRSIANGTYLYGETSQPGRRNSEYVVFENKSGKVFGAVFLANSEFSCFHGKLRSGQLDMMVVDNDSNAAYPYAVSLETGYSGNKNMEYKAVKKIGKPELKLLNSCRTMYKTSRWQSSVRG
jgi:hypothetical protein